MIITRDIRGRDPTTRFNLDDIAKIAREVLTVVKVSGVVALKSVEFGPMLFYADAESGWSVAKMLIGTDRALTLAIDKDTELLKIRESDWSTLAHVIASAFGEEPQLALATSKGALGLVWEMKHLPSPKNVSVSDVLMAKGSDVVKAAIRKTLGENATQDPQNRTLRREIPTVSICHVAKASFVQIKGPDGKMYLYSNGKETAHQLQFEIGFLGRNILALDVEHPKKEIDGFRCVGGGKIRMTAASKSVIVYGRSMDFGGYDKAVVEELLTEYAKENLTGFSVTVQ